ncbi:hypothetical protein CGZ92_03475 [Parenemella sanctibonifatiensis]|uniref:Uncharacterized protein n=1 Tax=Parenemella sanctibonifatiensis TaxID=2016505 RepID=A0A255EB32_9ACTN|nr:hypothetical protein CGZ92_03475 [Parenemella sanctibonifatiensis]
MAVTEVTFHSVRAYRSHRENFALSWLRVVELDVVRVDSESAWVAELKAMQSDDFPWVMNHYVFDISDAGVLEVAAESVEVVRYWGE